MSEQPKEAIQTVGGEPLDPPDYFSWENFCNHFTNVGFIEYPDGSVITRIQLSNNGKGLELGKAYRIKNITIKDGRADISISNFPQQFVEVGTKKVLMTFGLSYEVTRYNLPHIASYLCGQNFRVEIAHEKIAGSKWVLGNKYSIQLGQEQLVFRQGTM